MHPGLPLDAPEASSISSTISGTGSLRHSGSCAPLRAKAEAEGYKIKKFKVNSGNCYEIYGTKDGKKTEAWFNPETGASLGSKAE